MTLKFCAAVLPLLAAGAAMGGITYTLDQRGAMVSVYVGGMSD
ncbi:MAG: hypothetical protein SFY96_08700 [Planctomycetota bacterium]|nr:hypothetical protein [Planctomycetota bacterium]